MCYNDILNNHYSGAIVNIFISDFIYHEKALDLIYVVNNVLIMCKIMVPYCGFYIPWIHRNCVIIYYCHDFIFACSHNMNSFLLFKFQVSYFYEVMVWTFSSIFKDEIQASDLYNLNQHLLILTCLSAPIKIIINSQDE